MSLEAFGALLDPAVTKTTVRYWEMTGVSGERAVQIEKVVGIPRERLRPDLFAAKAGAA